MEHPHFKTHDVVQLAVATGRWPRGTTGTIVEAGASGALVEIDDDRGHTLDYVSVPYEALEPFPTLRQERLPA
jgi:hypothetical protein